MLKLTKAYLLAEQEQFISILMMDRSINLNNKVIKQLSYGLREDLAHGFVSTFSRIDKVCDSKFFSCINKNNIIHNPCKAHS